jgi:hypothetical protein
MLAKYFLQHGQEPDRPPVNGGVIDKDTSLFHHFYMNASRLQRYFCILTNKMGCISISGLVAA